LNKPRIVIAGTNSGAGKTTVTLGIMAALKKRGLIVQGFKVGPDYIDPSYHTAITGRPSRNLDGWMIPQEAVREVFHRGSDGADISVIEGVMGMYDGKDPLSNIGSTAELSVLLKAPVILVVNVSSMARSAAAVVLGFQQLDPSVHLAGVIVNQVGSKGHYELVKAAIEQMCQIPVIGYLTRTDDLQIPERHLGLIPALERGEIAPLFTALERTISETVDIDRIIELANQSELWDPPIPTLFTGQKKEPFVTLAVARDSAFNFYYPENIELLEWNGANIIYFSPLAGEMIPEQADGVYIGGGFPEEFAKQLSQHRLPKESLQQASERGMPIFAECGGYMFLTKTLTDRLDTTYPMTGILPATVHMQPRLAALGYREVVALQDTILSAQGERARGHEFHYSTSQIDHKEWTYAYEAVGLRGQKKEGYAKDNILAGYTHLHFGSNPNMVRRFLAACLNYRQKQAGN
jgi:cobyrinic acid a,c-diamide synthase